MSHDELCSTRHACQVRRLLTVSRLGSRSSSGEADSTGREWYAPAVDVGAGADRAVVHSERGRAGLGCAKSKDQANSMLGQRLDAESATDTTRTCASLRSRSQHSVVAHAEKQQRTRGQPKSDLVLPTNKHNEPGGAADVVVIATRDGALQRMHTTHHATPPPPPPQAQQPSEREAQSTKPGRSETTSVPLAHVAPWPLLTGPVLQPLGCHEVYVPAEQTTNTRRSAFAVRQRANGCGSLLTVPEQFNLGGGQEAVKDGEIVCTGSATREN